MTFLRLIWMPLLLLICVAMPASAKEEPDAKPGKTEEAKPPVKPAPLAVPDGSGAKAYKRLIQSAREYFNLDVDAWEGRKHFIEALQVLAKDGKYPLTTPAFLTWLVAQSRSLEPMMNDRKWSKKHDMDVDDRKAYGFEIQGDGKWMHVRAPKSYPSKSNKLESLPRPGPWPAVFALHDKRDPENKNGAGVKWLQRNWDKKIHADLFENWFLAMPIVAAAAYQKDGVIRADKVFAVLRAFWNHYHLDFDQLVLDGADEAILLACTNGAPFFSGIILRDLAVQSDTIVDTKLRASIKNIAHMPIYVVGKPKVAAALKNAGITNVTEGDGQASLVTWMNARRRVAPKKFNWTIFSRDQMLAYWVNVDSVNWDPGKREIDVNIEGNTITIRALGVYELTLFLNDERVDLYEPVKIILNDQVVHDKRLEVKKKFTSIHRDPKIMFEMKPVEVRSHRYYGWLQSGSIVRIPVPKLKDPNDAKKEGADVTPKETASPREVANAKKYLDKGREALAAGDKAKALKLADKGLALPFNKYTEDTRTLHAAASK